MDNTRMKKGLASLAIAGALFGSSIVGASAAPNQSTNNGAAGVVAATVAALNNVNVTDNTVQVSIVQLNNSLNNLTALNNVLNNSPILNNNNILQGITVQNISVLNNLQVTALNNALNNLDLAIGQVIGVAVLSSGDVIAFTR